ncbi:MAG: penicillin-binding transpeptidase domain-containing protein [Actinomycetota bacterium]|nr:penicillin-binding transpeptidase domain-containing protein [Actinomycetota bacterium]
MNKEISRLALFGVVLISALIVATTYWQTWAAGGLADRQDNAIQQVAQFTIKRGLIYAADGKTVLATNKPTRTKDRVLYFRRYPKGPLASHVVGYSTRYRNRAGIERSENDYLTGSNANLNTVISTELDKLQGKTVQGNDLVLTIDPQLQALANRALAGKCGSVVALEPTTGRVLVMASTPTYNPNIAEKPNFLQLVARIKGGCDYVAPLLNRATNGLFTPGSTFKIVTVAAALDSGAYTPDSTFHDPGYCEEYGKRVYNAGNLDQNGPEQFGTLSLFTGFQHSVNSVFCNIGKEIGAGAILDYAKRFGFYSVPPLETPINERSPSGLYEKSRLFRPKDPATEVDPGRLAFGQERMLTTPLQSAMVSAAIANGGAVMRPYVVARILDPKGKTIRKTKPDELGRAVKRTTAEQVTRMMVAAVTAGTGTAAQISGVEVAGKTGTAETGVNHVNTTWFTSFAPANAPRIAIAVVLEQQRGFGGTTAAPIAREIMQAYLSRGSK